MHIETMERAAAGAARASGLIVQLTPTLGLPGVTMHFSANEEIFGEEEAADFVYKVVSGVVRTTRILSDGRRQIGGFYFEGDVFGLEGGEIHPYSAEAVMTSEIALVRRSVVERASEQDGTAARQLWSLTLGELRRVEDQMLLLGRKNAAERVGSFLLTLSKRGASNTIDLLMTRSDIADHLGLTIETVSRTFSRLAREQAISLPSSRRVVLKNRSALN